SCLEAARLITAAGYITDPEKALKAVHKSFHDHGYAMAAFFIDQILDRSLVETDYVTFVANLITPCPETYHYIRNFAGPQVVLSHSNSAWVNAIMTRLELDEIIPLTHRIASEDIGHTGKLLSTAPFERAMALLGDYPADHIVMFEDTAANLIHAKALGMRTVLVVKDKNIPKPDYVDYIITRPHEIDALLQN
ncbi:MAG TPA: hypothetical protein VGF14_05485, partial [Alphaproteobacteria bacterium]